MKEDIAVEYPYVVVQFLQLPYADIGDYCCVPHSWIQSRRATDRKILVAYPDETPSITKMRIMHGDEPSEKWKFYIAIIKFESHSYENACEFIMKKIHNASRNRYSDVAKIDHKFLPATTTKRSSPPLKTIKLLDPQSKKNRNKLKVVNKTKLRGMILNSRKFPEYFNVKSRTPTSSKLPSFVSPENVVMKEPYEIKYQDQASRHVRSSSDDLLLRYPYLQQIPEKNNGTQVNSLGAGSRSTMGKTLYASKRPLAFVNQVCNYSQKPQENQLLSIHRKHLHHLALPRRIQNKRTPNLRTFSLDFPEPVIHDYNIGSNTSFAIQNPTNEANQFSQLEIPESSPVIQEHRQVLPKQKTPDQSSEVECATSEPTAHSKMTSASHKSIVCSNLAEYQDSIVEDMVVDELTETSYIEQNVFSGTRAENESSANPKALEEAKHSRQTIESSMKEGSPMVEAVTSSGISSTQDVDNNINDEQSNSLELNSDEIITASPNSNEQANQSVNSVLNQADIWADLFQKMKVNFSETCQIAHDLHESLVQSLRVIECIANTSENLRALKKGKVAVLTSKKVTTEVQQTAEENQAERKEEENPDVNMEEDKKEGNDVDSKSCENDDGCGGDIKDVKDQNRDNEIPKTTRGYIRTFVLPPEYDPHDTRWTLKYRKNDPKLNLVELVPGSSVFINSLKLAHCKLVAKGSKELARMLLVEIFSQSALSVCSLTGVRANAFNISGTNVRPGLDEKARITILSFVKEHALERNWGPFDSQSVINSLRSKIQDLRGKHGKTV